VTVLLLGGSTVYGPEVPDDQTLASQLSARLNELDPGHSYAVYNAGVFAADSLQERDRLAYEFDRGLKPDIVISFGGGMDIVDGVYQQGRGCPRPFSNPAVGSGACCIGFCAQHLSLVPGPGIGRRRDQP